MNTDLALAVLALINAEHSRHHQAFNFLGGPGAGCDMGACVFFNRLIDGVKEDAAINETFEREHGGAMKEAAVEEER